MKKLLIVFVFIFCLASFVSAQDTVESIEAVLDENVTAQDLGVSEPTTLPDSPLYFLKNWQRSIQSFFTWGSVKKAELKMKHTSEKLLEAKKLAEKTDDVEILKKGAEIYEQGMEQLKQTVDDIKEKAEDSPELEKFLNKFIKHQALHQRILEKLEQNVPEQAMERIRQTRKMHLENFGEIMTKLQNKENIRMRLENNLGELKGSQFKGFKAAQLLEKLEEKVPEEIKETIMQARETITENLTNKLESMNSVQQEKFQGYVKNVRGNIEKKMEIFEDILQRATIQTRERIQNIRENIIRDSGCTAITRIECLGRVIIRRDENGCAIPDCIITNDSRIRKITPLNPTSIKRVPQRACIALWDPVCGEDGETYSNKCWAHEAEIEVDYRGVCE